MHIRRDYLCSTSAHLAARHIAQGKGLTPALEHHREAATYILAAVEAGWFVLPYWLESGAYSREQFWHFSSHLQMHPGLPVTLQLAQAAVEHAQAAFKAPLFELIGSARNNRLPDPVSMVQSAPYSCSRMPAEFVAGTFTTADYCNLLDDVSARCQQVEVLASVLTRAGMLDPEACLASKVDWLREIGRPLWIPSIVRSVHYSYLSLQALEELRKLVSGSSDGKSFVEFVDRDQRTRGEETRASWRAKKVLVRNVAAVLSEAKSYHQATLTKLLRRDLGRHFCIRTHHHLQGPRLLIETGTDLELGNNAKAATPFELVNWVLALDSVLSKHPDDVHGFWDACTEASEALERMLREVA
ncbi:TPA: hypothetical protein ACWLUJ_006145 [Pseudomonas aeruginosa]|nr:hypothetical protein [Pseudomonas aeruginosa]